MIIYWLFHCRQSKLFSELVIKLVIKNECSNHIFYFCRVKILIIYLFLQMSMCWCLCYKTHSTYTISTDCEYMNIWLSIQSIIVWFTYPIMLYSYFSHPNKVCMSYFEHARLSLQFSWMFTIAAIRAGIHAFVPGWFENSTTVTVRTIENMLGDNCGREIKDN